eukprot:3947580-Pleurochrysis_carterae.AAC.1
MMLSINLAEDLSLRKRENDSPRKATFDVKVYGYVKVPKTNISIVRHFASCGWQQVAQRNLRGLSVLCEAH